MEVQGGLSCPGSVQEKQQEVTFNGYKVPFWRKIF